MTWTVEDFHTRLNENRYRNPGWREGQCYFNTLAELDPTLADMVAGTAVDPFYKDHRVNVFMVFVFGNISETP